jgi:hypothetical protein
LNAICIRVPHRVTNIVLCLPHTEIPRLFVTIHQFVFVLLHVKACDSLGCAMNVLWVCCERYLAMVSISNTGNGTTTRFESVQSVQCDRCVTDANMVDVRGFEPCLSSRMRALV